MRARVLISEGILVAIALAAGYAFLGEGFGLGESPHVIPAVIPAQTSLFDGAALPQRPVLQPAAMTQIPDPVPAAPPNYVGRDIQLFEAHWQGMDVRLLDLELVRKLNYPRGLKGLLIGEVTLGSADQGFLAGDVIVAVAQTPVMTVAEFQRQSRLFRNKREVPIAVLRKGQLGGDGRYTMRGLTLVLKGDPDLGFAQVEAAPMILPGDGPPHPYRGACTDCHAIGTGFELTPDPDLITLPPSPISLAIATEGLSPHRDRGPCLACHVVVR